MLALSRRGDTLFLHQPEQGLAIPVIVDFERSTIKVGMPPIDQLAHEFAVYDDRIELMAELDGPKAALVRKAERFSQRYTKTFAGELDKGTLTILQLRRKIEQHQHHTIRPSSADIGVAIVTDEADQAAGVATA